jgi:hypothetical protein
MFRALLAHRHEALQSGTWYIECVLCQWATLGLEWNARNIPSDACVAPPEGKQLIFDICRGP